MVHHHNRFTETSRDELKRRFVWDFRTGKELGSWKPVTQTKTLHSNRPEEFDISPGGRYLAVGGDDVLRVCEVGDKTR
jgi:hypothetical protein